MAKTKATETPSDAVAVPIGKVVSTTRAVSRGSRDQISKARRQTQSHILDWAQADFTSPEED